MPELYSQRENPRPRVNFYHNSALEGTTSLNEPLSVEDQTEYPRTPGENKEEIKTVINRCEHLAKTNNAHKFELNKQCSRLTNYMDRFQNHVGTILGEPETNIDLPFQKDLQLRTEAKNDEQSIAK